VPEKAAPIGARALKLNRWAWFAIFIAIIVCLPLLAVFWLALFPTENIWPHLLATVLPDYVLTTLLLMGGVAIGTLLIGVSTAWLVTHYDFAGRKIFNWALLLPFAVPARMLSLTSTPIF